MPNPSDIKVVKNKSLGYQAGMYLHAYAKKHMGHLYYKTWSTNYRDLVWSRIRIAATSNRSERIKQWYIVAKIIREVVEEIKNELLKSPLGRYYYDPSGASFHEKNTG